MKAGSIGSPGRSCSSDPARMIAPVLARLAGLYPEDYATGYAVDGLRGAISVRAPFEE